MEEVQSSENKPTENKETSYSAHTAGGGSEPQTISWTASNTPQVNQGGGRTGHGRSSSVGNGKSQVTIETGQVESERRHSDFHPPLLLPRSSSQLPGFLDLISKVDDPNDKNRIPPISYPNGTDGSSHTASSSPIRKQYVCTACKKSFPSKNSLSKHKQIHGERSHICGDCNAKFHTKKDLTRHRDTVHGENSSSYVCPVPDCARSNPKKAFSRRDNLRQHIIQLHDKRYLEEIRNPQSSSQSISQQERNPSKSPEDYEQNGEDMQAIDEVLGDHQYERSTSRSRSPAQVIMEDAESDDEDNLDENAMSMEDRTKDREIPEVLQAENPVKFHLRSHSPYERDESQDVIMTTPGIVVQDFGATPVQDSLPEAEIVARIEDDKTETNILTRLSEVTDEDWITTFLEGVSPAELHDARRLTGTGLKEKFPVIDTENKLNLIRVALVGFTVGFQQGYTTAQPRITEVAASVGTAVTPKASLTVVSPSSLSADDEKALLSPVTKGAFGPPTPTSIPSTSPATPHPLKNLLPPAESAFFGVAQKREPERGEPNKSFVVPPVPSRITTSEFGKPPQQKIEEETRPLNLATEAESASSETFQCFEKKCLKKFTKKSEFKKHMQRHRRPFYCTFHWQERGEVQRFGSKDDWRRHEEHRHYQSEFYKCPGGTYDTCRSSFPGRAEFEKHLEEHHKADISAWRLPNGKIDEEKMKDFLKANHNGTDYVEDNFWCGFCAKLMPIPPEMTGRRGKEIRVNHVADHFHKEQKDILEWVKYNDCDQSKRMTEIEKARAACMKERKRSTELDPDALDPHKSLPGIEHIVGNLGEFNPSTVGTPASAPEFWICCVCKTLLQNHPDFVYALNLPKDKECGSSGSLDHERHERCPRCSIARSQA